MTQKSHVLPGSSFEKQLRKLQMTAGHLDHVYHQSASRIVGYDDTYNIATRRYLTVYQKTNFMDPIIPHKNILIISCSKLSFLRKKKDILMMKRTGMYLPTLS